VYEIRQRISEPALTTHEGCGGEVTDYPSESRKKAKEAEKPATGNGDKPAAKSADKADKTDKTDKADKPAEKASTTTPSAPASSPTPKAD
jgi:hypothetical protein